MTTATIPYLPTGHRPHHVLWVAGRWRATCDCHWWLVVDPRTAAVAR